MHKVALVGCGHISQAHLKGWAQVPNCTVVGVLDVNAELAKTRAAQFEVPTVFADLSQAIDASDIVDVCTPPQTHSALAVPVLEAGRKLVIEKPVVTSLAEWEPLRALLGEDEAAMTVIHNFKFLNSVQKAKRWIEAGAIGDVVSIHHEFLVSPRNDRMLAEPHWSHSLPGGRWQETLPHPLYLTHFLAGPLQFDSLTVVAGDVRGAPATEVAVTLRGPSSWASVAFSATCEQKRLMVTVQGRLGRIVIDWLGDLVTLERIRDNRVTRAVGRTTIEAGLTALRAGPDRVGWVRRHLEGQSPHALILKTLGLHLDGNGPTPTPREEIEYVIHNCDLIGSEIDRTLERTEV